MTGEHCACARVVWKERHSKVDGATFGWWGCDLCGREFVTKASRDRIGHDFEDRLDECKREVERRDELLAGADADLKAEREKAVALRALLGDCEIYLLDCKRDWGNNDLLERIKAIRRGE